MANTRVKKTRTPYTVESGRNIYFNGRPFISIRREGDLSPASADRYTHKIASLLNSILPR